MEELKYTQEDLDRAVAEERSKIVEIIESTVFYNKKVGKKELADKQAIKLLNEIALPVFKENIIKLIK